MPYSPAASRYESLPYRPCGRSGLRLPAVSLGLWHNFGGVDDAGTARDMILSAFDAGITHFDLANNYGPPPGSAETTFGRVLREDLGAWRDECIVATKAGYLMWPGPYGDGGSRKYLLASLDQSLRRMGLDYVDIFYSHRPDPATPLEETVGALVTAVRSGKALYVGVSNYPPELTLRTARLLAEEGIPLTLHQPRYNLFERQVEDGLAAAVAETGTGLIAFCPLAQGVLTGKYLAGITEGSRASKSVGFLKPEHITAEKLRRVAALAEIAGARGQSLAQMALSWVLSRPSVTSVLIGASSPAQIAENVAAASHTEFSAEESAAIDAACRLA